MSNKFPVAAAAAVRIKFEDCCGESVARAQWRHKMKTLLRRTRRGPLPKASDCIRALFKLPGDSNGQPSIKHQFPATSLFNHEQKMRYDLFLPALRHSQTYWVFFNAPPQSWIQG